MRRNIIVACDLDGGIGFENDLPWARDMPADMKHFRSLTVGMGAAACNAVIMGRKTYESIGRPLPQRTNIVLSRRAQQIEGVLVAHSLDEAYKMATKGDAEDAFIIGGQQVYAEALPTVDRVYLTEIGAHFDTDTRFPDLEPDKWQLVESEPHDADARNKYPYTFTTYDRIWADAERPPDAGLPQETNPAYPYVNLAYARTDDQREVMKAIEQDKVCPFCREHLEQYHKEPILREGEHWLLTHSQWPYEGTDLHLLAIARQHAERLSDLPEAAAGELMQMFQWAEKEYGIQSGAINMRFGEMTKSGATVRHLHAHMIVPADGYKADFKPKLIRTQDTA